MGAAWDFLPTFAELAGATPPPGIDGQSLVPTLLENRPQPDHEALYWESVAGGHQAVRRGDWKAIRLRASKNPDAPVQLFNLATDPAETNDVASKNPDITTKVTELLKSSRIPSPEFPMGLLDP